MAENSWIQGNDAGLVGDVNSISGSASFKICSKLKALKSILKERKESAFSEFKEWNMKGQEIDLTTEELMAKEEAKEEYRKWILLEEIHWRQK